MQSSKSILIVMALSSCLATFFVVQVQAGAAKMTPEECSKRASQLDGQLEDYGEELINMVECEAPDCTNNGASVSAGIIKAVEIAKELGEMKACAKGKIHGPSDVNEAMKEQLQETISVLSSGLDDARPKTRQLFSDIIKEAQAAYKKL